MIVDPLVREHFFEIQSVSLLLKGLLDELISPNISVLFTCARRLSVDELHELNRLLMANLRY